MSDCIAFRVIINAINGKTTAAEGRIGFGP